MTKKRASALFKMIINTLASGSDGNCYIVERDGPALMVEAGLPFEKLKKLVWQHDYKLADLAGCLVSHVHADHSQAAEDLIKRGVPTYMGKFTAEPLGLASGQAKILKAKKAQSVGPYLVQAFPLRHGGIDNFGFLITHKSGPNLFYATDTAHIPYVFKNLNYLMVECNYIESRLDDAVEDGQAATNHATKSIKSHLSLDSLVGWLRHQPLGSLREIYLLHLSAEFAEAQRCRRMVQETTGIPTKIAEGG